jgi:hypothetical protein
MTDVKVTICPPAYAKGYQSFNGDTTLTEIEEDIENVSDIVGMRNQEKG